jgi:hypothetical protein
LALFAGQVHLGGQAAAGPAQAVIGRLGGYPAGRLGLQVPLLRAPAACWCARANVESTDTSQVISPAASARACNLVMICRQVPSRCQRRNSPYTDGQGPYRAGTSRHGVPVRTRHRVPSISCRLLHFRGRPGFLPRGSRVSSTFHCASVSAAGHGSGRHEVSGLMVFLVVD